MDFASNGSTAEPAQPFQSVPPAAPNYFDEPSPVAAPEAVNSVPPTTSAPDSEERITIAEAIDLYAAAGVPRADRSLQRYCARGDLDCSKVYNETEVHYLITRSSIERHIDHLRSQPQPIQIRHQLPEAGNTPSPSPRQAGNNVLSLRRGPTAQLTQQLMTLQVQTQQQAQENAHLKNQLAKKDEIITHMMDRDRVTTQVMANLQQMLARFLQGPGER